MINFIDENRDAYGVEPVCDVIEIAPATYYEHKRQEREPGRRSTRAKRDEALKLEIQRVFDDDYGVYGVRKVWIQLNREDISVAKHRREYASEAAAIAARPQLHQDDSRHLWAPV